MVTLAHLNELRALLARAPEPGNLRRPRGVSAFFHEWSRWRAEASDVAATLDRALSESHVVASQNAADGPGDAASSALAVLGWLARLTPAQARAVAAEILAERGRAPSSAELVAVLRERFGVSRATAYRALRGDIKTRRNPRREVVVFS
jgi:hypothetical protein